MDAGKGIRLLLFIVLLVKYGYIQE